MHIGNLSENTALHLACQNGDFDAVKIIFDYSPSSGDILNKENNEKDTPLAISSKMRVNGLEYDNIYNYLN